MLEQGNGLVNALTAVQLAEGIDLQAQEVREAVPPKWTLRGGEEVWVGGAFAYRDQIAYSRLVDFEEAQSILLRLTSNEVIELPGAERSGLKR